METRLHFAVPTIYINGTTGKEIIANGTVNYTLNYDLHQLWEENVESYNVIGEIEGTHPRRTLYLQCLYDGWWNQATGDSAVGMGIVMTIAKYMNELKENYSIQPYTTVKFIGYGGEEAGLKGAWQHEYKNRNIFDIGKPLLNLLNDEKLVTIIDLNQLGFDQTDPRMTFDIFINNGYLHKDSQFNERTWAIAEETNYVERTNNKTDLSTYSLSLLNGWNYNGDQQPYVYNIVKQRKQHILSFLKTKGPDETLMPWTYHHRTGDNYTQGDALDQIDWEDVNISAELIWNFTKYFAYDTNCCFNDSASSSFTTVDSDSDGDDDTIRATFTIDTTLPHDMVTARVKVQKPKGLTWRTMMITRYDFVIRNQSTEVSLDVTLPPNADSGTYRLKIELLDSTSRIQDKIFKNNSPSLLQGFIDDWKFSGWFTDLHPVGNTKPGKPTIALIDDPPIVTGQSYNYSFTATDPDGDLLTYRIDWNTLIPLWGNSLRSNPVESGETYIKNRTYYCIGPKIIKARAQEYYGNYADWSFWRPHGLKGEPEYFYIDWVDFSSYISMSPHSTSTTSLSTGVSQQTGFYGHVLDDTHVQGYEWTFIPPESKGLPCGNYTKNCNQTFDDACTYTIWFNVTDIYGNITSTSTTLEVKDTHADYTINPEQGAKPYETIIFNDTSTTEHTIEYWNWSFGDGTTTNGSDVTHIYNTSGSYTITLTVTDDQDNIEYCNKTILVGFDMDPPTISHVDYEVLSKENETTAVIVADISDAGYGVEDVGINITTPLLQQYNLTMSQFLDDTYYIYFNHTEKSGNYTYTIWTKDTHNHTNLSTEYLFYIAPVFGYVEQGNLSECVADRITGSIFTCHEYGTVESIIRVHPDVEITVFPPGQPRMKCMIFRVNDSVLIGTTEEKSGMSTVFNFTDPKPVLENDTEYLLAIWGNNSNAQVYYDVCDEEIGRHYNTTYNETFFIPISWVNETRKYSLYCTFAAENTPPDIDNVGNTSTPVGLGGTMVFSVNVTDDKSGVSQVVVEVTYPDETIHYYTLEEDPVNGEDGYILNFSDTWLVGQYNYSFIVYDAYQNSNISGNHSFVVSTNNVGMSVCTVKNTYGVNESINITDPPPNSGSSGDSIGYELLDDGSVLHIWNTFDSYYFNTSSGIQLTNHYDEYWTHNVLMLGYYNNDQWNIMYRTDELSGFNKNIVSDNDTFVNATLWKDLTYSGYDFRLAIRYHLCVDDNELTIIPYIKNIDDEDIPYVLGFGWELQDIQVDMTEIGDYIVLGNESYFLNQSLDNNYTNLSDPIYCFNEVTNETEICGYSDPAFYLMENITDNTTESLYLRWDKDLTYKLQVKSRASQYNAPVTLFVRIGTLNNGQEKYTEMYWYDADQYTYYFDSYDTKLDAWETNPGNMVDGSTSSYASTGIRDDSEYCDSTSFGYGGAPSGTVSKVEIRAYGKYEEIGGSINIKPTFNGGNGDNHYFSLPGSAGWSSWFDITDDTNAPEPWTWSDVGGIDCSIIVCDIRQGDTFYCHKVEIRVTNNEAPVDNNPVPADGSVNVSISPTLSINVSDAEGDSMNITWYSNSSGAWTSFGINNSVGNGTYYQTFGNASVNGQWWYWKVNVSDGSGYNESEVYRFYTGVQSKIENMGCSNISGYLLMQIYYYNESMELWELDNSTINETSPRIINADDTLGLDTIFNGLVCTGDLTHGDGTYCVFAAFRDEYGEIFECDDLSLLYAYWEFELDTS
jgi:hypothetical protein